MDTKQLNPQVFQLNWILQVWESILKVKGMTLPPTSSFKIEMEEHLIQQVKEYTPKENWGSRGEDEMTSFIRYETKEAIRWLFSVYVNSTFPSFLSNLEKEKPVSPIQIRVLFFLLVFLIAEGLLGSIKNFLESNSARGNFYGATHLENVEELFSFIPEN